MAIEWALVELMNHPKLLHQARQEIHDVVGDHRLVEESDRPNLSFLQAVVKETFCLHPPTPLLITRRCVPECAIENYMIPENTLLFVNVWAIGRDPNHWESPLDFRPERFLKPIEESSLAGLVDVRGQHFQLLPFGSGRKMCPGVALAMQEVPLLGAIIQCFVFRVVGPHGKILKGEEEVIDVDERPGLTVPRANDLVCVPIARPICGPLLNLGS